MQIALFKIVEDDMDKIWRLPYYCNYIRDVTLQTNTHTIVTCSHDELFVFYYKETECNTCFIGIVM